MSGHADTALRIEGLTPAQAEAVEALVALVTEQADRIAWLEGEVAGSGRSLTAAR